MDLKIKDVAEMLNVSETTIRRWLSDGKIPAYKINQQYRFSRSEIEDWVMKHKLKDDEGVSPFSLNSSAKSFSIRGGQKQYSLYRALHKGGNSLRCPRKNNGRAHHQKHRKNRPLS